MIAPRRIAAVARVELLRLLRSRTTFTLLVLVPALQIMLFGYAIRPNAASVSVAVAAPTSANAADAARALRRLPGLTIIAGPSTPGAADKAVRDGRALIGVEVPALRSFANPTQVQHPFRVVVDGTNAALTNAAVARIEAGYWRGLAERADAADSGPGIAVERLYNPDGRADWTFLPALIGVTVMIAMVMLGSLSLACDRETGSWEGLLGLPIAPAETFLGKLVPYAAIGTVQGLLVLAAGCCRCSRRRMSRSAMRSPRGQGRSLPHCRARSPFTSPRCSCQASSTRSRHCRNGRAGLATPSRSPILSAPRVRRCCAVVARRRCWRMAGR
jgi:ABC-2 type transport system permease protein